MRADRNRKERRDLLKELSLELRKVDPGALMVSKRILRRVIKEQSGLRGLGLQVPHAACHALSRERLLATAGPAEVGLDSDVLPGTCYLIAAPHPRALRIRTKEALSRRSWRLLFHAMIHSRLDEHVDSGQLNPENIWEKIVRIGQTQFDEIRAVLHHEELLLDPEDDVAIYAEFVALYLELRIFDPAALEGYFPTLSSRAEVEALVLGEVDADACLEQSRPASCHSPRAQTPDIEEARAAPVVGRPSRRLSARLVRKARRCESKGNLARGAILYATAARHEGSESAAHMIRARNALDGLGQRLASAVGAGKVSGVDVSRSLVPLLEHCERGRFNVEARLLYDLQKACVATEQTVRSLGLVTWLTSFGRRSLIRKLPCQQRVRMVRRIKTAERRLHGSCLSRNEREALGIVLRTIVHHCETDLRREFRERIGLALVEVGLVGRNHPERVAASKLTEELLDRIVKRGFIQIGDLRDVIAQNQLKLGDIDSLGRFFGGDRFLRADRALSRRLEGVYRRGEIYMRFLQRVSSLAFGTWIGRILTLYVVIPFGGSFVILEGLEHTVMHLVNRLVEGELTLVTATSIMTLGAIIGSLVHIEPTRRGALALLKRLGRALRFLCLDLPGRLLSLRWVAAIRQHPWSRRVYRYVLKPLAIFSVPWAFVPVPIDQSPASALSAAGAFLGVNMLLNSRLGRITEELVADWAARFWQSFRYHVIPGAFEVVIEAFSFMLEWMERALYTVDEWLRFKSGEGRAAFFAKLVLGFLWAICTYLFRIYINLLVEPQVNPIKHFPVVTVSHKIILPMSGTLLEVFRTPFVPILGEVVGSTLAGATVFLLPGVFGFLVWEFKSNWRLYKANRASFLKREIIGEHSETMLRFMKPGFHSGTLPKLFAKLRKSEIRGHTRKAQKVKAGLHHVKVAVSRFAERRFVALLNSFEPSEARRLRLGGVQLSTKRIRVSIHQADVSTAPLVIAFEEKSGWLVAGIHGRGWLDGLDAERQRRVEGALTGFYKRAGVDVVREQLQSVLGLDGPYDICRQRLVVWKPRSKEPALGFSLAEETLNIPSALCSSEDGDSVKRSALFFSANRVPWTHWVAFWQGIGDSGEVESKLVNQPLLG